MAHTPTPQTGEELRTAVQRLERFDHDAYQILRGFLPRKPYPTLDGFKMVFAELSDQIPAAKTADPRDFVDTRLLEELDRSGYIDGLYR